MKTLMVMAGGTGGHVYPAMAVADHLQAKGWQVVWLCTEGGMENRLITNKPYEKAMITMQGVRGKGLLGWLKLPYKLFIACKQAKAAIKQHQPNLILGMGGFAAFPGGLMAKLTRTPLVIHEQNSVAGLTNKVMTKLANRTLAAFPDAFGDKATLVGNPVRQDIMKIMHPEYRFDDRNDPFCVLVIGGSLGAKVFNDVLPAAFARVTEKRKIQVVHQAGEKHIEALTKAYEAGRVNATPVAFIKNMHEAYEWADLVICRAGALTIAELSAGGVASILVPFPFAVDDHQTSNAGYLSENSAAVLMPQPLMTEDEITEVLTNITREDCIAMANNAHKLGQPNATTAVAQICEEYAK